MTGTKQYKVEAGHRRSTKDGSGKKPKTINLALQGGGAHGAFSWGVVDKLLEDGRIRIEAVSGTSAGAMNAVVLADGLAADGSEGAREALHQFWKAVNNAASLSPVQRSPLDLLTGNWNLDYSPGYLFFDILSRIASPYELNPLNINPLRELLIRQVDFERVRNFSGIKLFISATHVRTGRIRVFEKESLAPEHVMASACVPFVFHAVEIDGESYWDGAYMGNPALFPFIRRSEARDIVIVQINPLERGESPRTARDILDRINEITFNASLVKEFRAIDFVTRLLDEGSLDEKRYKRLFIHIIAAESEMGPLGVSSKLNAEWSFLKHLRDLGRRAAEHWLDRNFSGLGERSTVDLRSLYHGNS
ncbi:MAG: patatin-like phospholipase family protein [Methylococcaceae bacterium]|nr:patatin-like phospholipase family protein [Methylococcaceae bacterium]MCI0733120.1 patatin-like phospholipase family protein [Methylococcaceae bacterium]